MLRELTRAKTLLILTFLVAIFAIYYHSNNDTNPSPSTSQKTDYGGGNSDDPADSSIEEIEMEPNDFGPEQRSEEHVANSDKKDGE